MSMRRLIATGLFIVFLTASVHAEDKDPATETFEAVFKSAAGKGGEVAVKWAAGFFYDNDCKNKNNNQAMGYICKVLGSVSGRTEDEWKADVTKQLTEINGKLDVIETGQKQIQKTLNEQYKVMDARFKQVSAEVVAGTHLVRIEGLWEKYQAQFDKVDGDVTRDAMLSFAKEIMKSQPHTILGDLNVVLTKPTLEGQPLVRYPFYEWRLKNEARMIPELKTMELYEFAETKFMDFRMSEQKAYAMYMWAAAVLETQCQLKPAQCTKPPRSTEDFKADYARYTRQQLEAFNAAVDWFVLDYSTSRATATGNFMILQDAESMLRRANFLSASTLLPNEGLWGRVISMGDKWDGSLQVSCGGAVRTLTPVMKYSVPVNGTGRMISGKDSGPLDWWVSTQKNDAYDEVRFSSNWQMYQYSLPTAKAGPCTIARNQPGTYLPWVQAAIPVVDVKTADKREFPFGSFVAIQRAGGAYALLSGSQWNGTMTPERVEDGKGQREKVEYEWFIEPNHNTGPRMGLYTKGRGEFKVGNGSSRIHNRNKIILGQSKTIRVPDDPTVKIYFFPGYCNGKLCGDPGQTGLMSYNIENNDTESKKGKLDAMVSISLRDTSIDGLPTGQGIVIDGSYGKTGDRKEKKVSGEQVGTVSVRPDKRYQLTYYIYFDLETEGRGWDATEYQYSGQLGTALIYLSK
jgi:hypothetical protein